MKKTRVALAGETALFRYGVIADFVYPPPGPKGLYQQIKKKAEQVYTIPGSIIAPGLRNRRLEENFQIITKREVGQ